MTNQELANAIRKGLKTPNFKEYKGSFLEKIDNTIYGCVCGAALLGASEDVESALTLGKTQ